MLMSSSSEMIYCCWLCGVFLICGVHSPSSPICVSLSFDQFYLHLAWCSPLRQHLSLNFFECQLIFSPVLRHKIFVCVSSTQDLSSIL